MNVVRPAQCVLDHARGHRRISLVVDEDEGAPVAINQAPKTSEPHPQHCIYPYLLRHVFIKQGEDGTPVVEICRKADQAGDLFNWKKCSP